MHLSAKREWMQHRNASMKNETQRIDWKKWFHLVGIEILLQNHSGVCAALCCHSMQFNLFTHQTAETMSKK